MPDKKTIDPATLEILEIARNDGMVTAFDRADTTQRCPIGHDGACCKLCDMGPCRLVGKTQVGICGATKATVAARNLARQIAGGTASHCDHGRHLSHILLDVSEGLAPDYQIKDEHKLRTVAEYMGIPYENRSKEEIAKDVALSALSNYNTDKEEADPVKRAPAKRQEVWRKLGITPRGLDREVVEAFHSTHMGTDQDAEHILTMALRVALADGWGGSMLTSDIGDILFGTPGPVASKVNLGVLRDDEVNVLVHGHDPSLAEILVVAATEPDLIELAKSKGAKGINLAGICCNANEVLMRHGVPVVANFLSSEPIMATGAVEAMVVDVQCIMQGIVAASELYHTKIITTSPKAHITGATRIEFDERRGLEIAKEILRVAIENYPNRKEVRIPDYVDHMVAGFSHEYINYMLGGMYRQSFRPLNDNIINGRLRGAAGVVGCNNARITQDEDHLLIVKELLRNDILVVTTGCDAIACAKQGLLTPEVMDIVGPGLREVCQAIGIPPVLHMGACVDNSRILTVLAQCVSEGGLGDDISDLPVAGFAPEWMSEKALAIGCYFVASGVTTWMGGDYPVASSPEAKEIITEGWKKSVGAAYYFEKDPAKAVQDAIALIDEKRKALKLVEYDPSKFAQSEAYLPADYAEFEEFTKGSYSRSGV